MDIGGASNRVIARDRVIAVIGKTTQRKSIIVQKVALRPTTVAADV